MSEPVQGILIGLAIGLPTLICPWLLLTYWNARHYKMKLSFIWYDIWIGAYWDKAKRRLYICPLPMVVFSVDFNNCTNLGHDWVFEGGRPCPWNLSPDCSQSVHRCSRCGVYDYGRPGGPDAKRCEEQCWMKIPEMITEEDWKNGFVPPGRMNHAEDES
jgi:hypothetical protein